MRASTLTLAVLAFIGCSGTTPDYSVGEHYDSGPRKSETPFVNGKAQGLAVGWYESGAKRSEESWKDGMIDGVANYWDEQGYLTRKTFKDGREVE